MAQYISANSNKLLKLMRQHLRPKGNNPVHSIQTYLSYAGSVFNEAVGFADGKEEIADKDNQFKIASITKTMTATVILKLLEKGKLSLDDSIAKYLSQVEYVKVNELHYFNRELLGNSITIRQLLQHKSGIADIFTDAAFRFYLNEGCA